jgi:hypothetical protein
MKVLTTVAKTTQETFRMTKWLSIVTTAMVVSIALTVQVGNGQTKDKSQYLNVDESVVTTVFEDNVTTEESVAEPAEQKTQVTSAPARAPRPRARTIRPLAMDYLTD